MNTPTVEAHFEEVSCILCGEAKDRLLFKSIDYNRKCPGLFKVVQCKHCDLVYVNPRPTQRSIHHFYPSQEWTRVARRATLENAEVLGMHWREFMAQRASVILSHRKQGRVLELGSGDGLFLRYFLEKGWDCVGIEPSIEASQYARDVFGVPVQTKTLEDVDLPEASFDVVILFAAIEHFHDPLTTLKKIAKLIKKDGIVYLGAIPNFESLDRILFGKRWAHMNLPRHLYHFTPRTFDHILKKAGLRTLRRGMQSHEGKNRLGMMGYTDSLRYALRDFRQTSKEDSQAQSLKRRPPPQTRSIFVHLKRPMQYAEYITFRVIGNFANVLGRGSTFWVLAERQDKTF